MRIATISSVSFDGTGFSVTLTEGIPPIRSLGTVIGYAKREQKHAGRTPFDMTTALNGLYFRPATTTTDAPEKLQEELLLYLESIGFHYEEPKKQERRQRSLPLSYTVTATASQQLTA
jgi:hypothetical protein